MFRSKQQQGSADTGAKVSSCSYSLVYGNNIAEGREQEPRGASQSAEHRQWRRGGGRRGRQQVHGLDTRYLVKTYL